MSAAERPWPREAPELCESREPWFVPYLRDVHSQCGEDGVLQRLFELLGVGQGWAVELGAADGVWLSNSRLLIGARGWSGVLIEPDASAFERLDRLYAGRSDVHRCRRRVSAEAGSADSLEALLRQTPIPAEFELLSIDVDGNDYHVWKSLAGYRPRVVVIEFNPTIPTEVSFAQADDPELNQGASLRALVELGRDKGYELAGVTSWNAIFVLAEDWRGLGLGDNSMARFRRDTSLVTHLFFGYDGTALLAGAQHLPWHRLRLRSSDMQVLPAPLRRYPPLYSRARRRLFELWRWWSRR